jgi:NAD(P)-dependent dehydrogenase (short-subunit alcohol dehydrogenase family)
MFEGTLRRMGEAQGWPDDMDVREAKFMDLGLFPCASERYGRPEDIGALVALLASPLSAFINGADYRIDGGQVQSVN